MRCWTTGRGTLLVEIETPAGEVDYGPLYRELDLQGAPVQTFRAYAYSVQEYLGTYHYRVDDASLVECWTQESDRGPAQVVEELDQRQDPATRSSECACMVRFARVPVAVTRCAT